MGDRQYSTIAPPSLLLYLLLSVYIPTGSINPMLTKLSMPQEQIYLSSRRMLPKLHHSRSSKALYDMATVPFRKGWFWSYIYIYGMAKLHHSRSRERWMT